jgi:hypothetical protein
LKAVCESRLDVIMTLTIYRLATIKWIFEKQPSNREARGVIRGTSREMERDPCRH